MFVTSVEVIKVPHPHDKSDKHKHKRETFCLLGVHITDLANLHPICSFVTQVLLGFSLL